MGKTIKYVMTAASIAAWLSMTSLLLTGCRSAQAQAQQESTESEAYALPRAQIYKMTGDYADNVAVTLSVDGLTLVSFSDPSDITPQSRPVALEQGWWLDLRGVGANTYFTRYTFSEYAALDEVPSVAELKAAIIPGARVSELVQLPMTASAAASDVARVNKLIADGLPGATSLFSLKGNL